MKAFIQTALDLGWTLLPYEADQFKWLRERHGVDFSESDGPKERIRRLQEFQGQFMSPEYTNWREEQQALNIIHALAALPSHTPLLAWCGNSHLLKIEAEGWIPMGYQFKKQSGIDPFVMDQTVTVKFGENQYGSSLAREYAAELESQGGTAGFLREEGPLVFMQRMEADAFLLSTQNDLD